ncbi:UNVERIFIED_CONTAM: hypothetical protein RMT77_019725 [Armadillidium vulgare]
MKLTGYKIIRKKCCCGFSLRTGTLLISLFQLLTVSVWLVFVIFHKKIFKKNLRGPEYFTLFTGIYNIIITVFTSCSILLGYIQKNELVLKVSLVFELILIISILVTSVVLFFYKFWMATFAGIGLIFLYFYFYSVIGSYTEEVTQIRKFQEVSASAVFLVEKYNL